MSERIPKRPAEERVRDFFEVALGFSKKEAEKEARRCLDCKSPACINGCPVEIDIPAFIKLIKEGRTEQALEKIREKNNLPAICGRVCPQENQCEAVCVLNKKKAGIRIGALERYAADRNVSAAKKTFSKNSGVPVAVVGSGPAGLTCAADLAKLNYAVTVFESLHLAGGVLVYGIPEFRLPKEKVNQEIERIESLGVTVETDILIGRTLTIRDLFDRGFKAIFIAAGAGLPEFLGIEGENLCGVYSANEFLTRINLMKAYKFPEYATPVNLGIKIAVIGAGNVAFDCARTAIRLKKEVVLLYRRSEDEMPARKAEIDNAKEEGVVLNVLTQPVKILGDEKGFVKGIRCIKMEPGEPDGSGRRQPLPVNDSEFVIDADTVITAIGQSPNPLLAKLTTGLAINAGGTIKIDDDHMTSINGVFAGGDIVTGADTIISAMGAGKRAAVAIDKYLKMIAKYGGL